jgi:hypothetical protein
MCSTGLFCADEGTIGILLIALEQRLNKMKVSRLRLMSSALPILGVDLRFGGGNCSWDQFVFLW